LVNIAVLCSGKGTNLQAIINAVKRRKIKANLKLVLGDKQNAFCLKRARKAGIKTVFIDSKKYKGRKRFDQEVIKHLIQEDIDLIVLAGFMRILSDYFIKKYRNRIINIHPALLPSFKGAKGIKDAYEYGVRVTGVTVHFVNEELDNGPIILQDVVKIKPGESIASLEKKIHKLEHKLYPEAINLFSQGKLKIKGRKVKRLK
jgi:phosphoribosylglycinamide formyltransferase-1